MKSYRFKLARRIVKTRKRQEAKRDKIGITALLSFAVLIATSILTNY